MPDAFENILGQAQVRDFLRATIVHDRVSHAYLFTGPAGSNKTLAAYAFSQAILCKEGGCPDCDCCQRVMRRKHPDVRYFAPEGVGGYLVEQVREIITDTGLAPIQASRKVYILDRVDLLGTQAANAFLKTLEEPPEDVVLILLGRTRESVLPTIVSRCQVVPFRHIPAGEAAGILSQNTGASTQLAHIAIQACGGSITNAVDFLKSPERMAFRAQVLEVLGSLALADDWDVLTYAQDLVVKARSPLDVVRAAQDEELAESADFLAKSAIRQLEARNKRMLSAASLESLRQMTAIIRSWLRDIMVVCGGCLGLVINTDIQSTIEEAAGRTDVARTVAALEACRHADEAIAYNVSPETCIDALLFEIREVLYGTSRANKAPV
ncbi:MAG: DNA polymerase III subunit delta [Eggerthellaceae bacterium]|jgi:DNA polymerase-3 subunit delta'|nr:DNA polymerase III subunit delta [Eggerthellaceae bacterium]MDR2716265.1 DNA polymerase III subunit delta' [Coriobacteriaceae bacterium]